jgi:mycoredoxin-dependent peroxiredoxin
MFSASLVNAYSQNTGLTVGETIPNPEFQALTKYEVDQMPRPVRMHDYKEDKNMLVVFMPDISGKNTYSKVMATAFDTYFAEGLAFIKGYDYAVSPGELKVLIVTHNTEAEVKEYLTKYDLDFDMASDINLDISHFFGVHNWNSKNEGSFVYVVNKENKITYASYDYKGEGEKLKSVQKELFTLYDIKDDSFTSTEYTPLMPGEKSRDFDFEYIYNGPPTAGLKHTEEGKLSDYIGKKNVIIAFYPAPFSMSCAMEVTKFDSYAEDQMIKSVKNSDLAGSDDVEILMISQSNTSILSKWKHEMGLQNVKLISDNTGAISSKYGSYNTFGYNKRTLFLIDKSGNVSYIDWDYQVNDEDFAIVEEHLKSLN